MTEKNQTGDEHTSILLHDHLKKKHHTKPPKSKLWLDTQDANETLLDKWGISYLLFGKNAYGKVLKMLLLFDKNA